MKTIFYNGHFYTGNGKFAKALVVENNLIREALMKEPPPAKFEKNINAHGQYVFPGFVDAHNHPARHSRIFDELDLRDVNTWAQACTQIQEYAEQKPTDQCIVVHGWNETTWGALTQTELDACAPHHSLLLFNISNHGGLVNAQGLKKLFDVGFMQSHAIAGRTGYLVENDFEKAVDLTAPDAEQTAHNINKFLYNLTAHGITAVHDLEVNSFEQLEAYAILHERHDLIMPVELYVRRDVFADTPRLKKIMGRVPVRGLKLFFDGALETHTAALYKTYQDAGGTNMVLTAFEEARTLIKQAADLGLEHVAMHCIGPRAIDAAVEVFEQLQDEFASSITQWRFEHFEMPSTHAIETLARRGGVACMQPNFSWDAVNYHDRLGDDVRAINPLRAILDAGIKLMFGSDDMPTSPLEGIAWACEKAPFEDQRITRAEAFDTYIQKDRQANFVMFEENPLIVKIETTEKSGIKETWLKGTPVYKEKYLKP